MRIFYPVIKGGSGGDIYFERLSSILKEFEVQSDIKYYPTSLQFLPHLSKFFHTESADYDIIHSASDWGFAFKEQSKPLVIITHHLVFKHQHENYKSIPQKLFHKLLFKYTQKSFNVADKIIAMSNLTKMEIEDIFKINNVEVIYNGIDTNFFRPLEIENDPYPDKIKLLYIGNLTKRKGAHLLPQIMDKLDDRFVLFYTSGLRTNNMFSNNKMIPLGRISSEKLLEMYNLCDMLLVPSIIEGGFSYAAAEAMACKKPIVASISSGLYEMIEDKGGALCENVDEFVSNIQEIANDDNLRKAMGEYNRENVIKKFDIVKTGKQYYDTYKKLI